MSEAIDSWLACREAWIVARSRASVDKLGFATDLLYAAFVEDSPDPRVVNDAFFQFHKMLAEQQDKGNPLRVKFHRIPITMGHA
jgi:hypothetical protein